MPLEAPGTAALRLAPLSAEDARTVLGSPGTVPDAELDEVARLCGRLPLALSVAAARLREDQEAGRGCCWQPCAPSRRGSPSSAWRPRSTSRTTPSHRPTRVCSACSASIPAPSSTRRRQRPSAAAPRARQDPPCAACAGPTCWNPATRTAGSASTT
ncbi:hypothetical protein SAZ11_27645 [Streptomyces sp. FXJ1.4098]|nr:hypothetical protein [Streptomyces sp. FXJ1.4098]